MAYSVTTKKTWASILDDIETALDKWGKITGWRVDAVLAPRSSTKQNQTEQERTVTLHYTRKGKTYQITMGRQRRAVDNLLVIWLILEALRLNEARGFAAKIAAVYRQEFLALPAPGQSGQPAAGVVVTPYALLYLRDGAPIDICEAAYRALAKRSHPDIGGPAEYFRRITEAIEQIRKEKAK